MMTPFHVMQMAMLRDENRLKEVRGLASTRPGEPIQLYGEFRGESAPAPTDDAGHRAAGTARGRNKVKRWTFLPVLGR